MTEVISSRPSSIVAPPVHVPWIRRLMVINLAFIALQPVSAGIFLTGYERAVTMHASVALALQVGALVQAVTAVVQWRRRRLPGRVAGFSVALFVLVLLQSGLGYSKQYWLHVPLGVGMLVGLVQQLNRFDAQSRTAGARL